MIYTGTQKIICPISLLRINRVTSPESNAEARAPVSQFKGPRRPLGATAVVETNNLDIVCTSVL